MPLKNIAFIILGLGAYSSAYSTNLNNVYNQALKSDPTFKLAESAWLVAKESRASAMVGTGVAGSGLFPSLTASWLGDKRTVRGTRSYNYDNMNIQLNLKQPVFNLATWSSIRGASFDVKAAYATYMAAGQDLTRRVGIAYLEVLRANENLRYTLREKEADRMELKTDLEKYRVGLIPVTGVYDAQASYDKQIATEINNRNTLINSVEDLRAMTGARYQTFQDLPARLMVVSPKSMRMVDWVKTATRQSYAIKSAQMALQSAHQKTKTLMRSLAPTVNIVGNYTYDQFSLGYFLATGSARSQKNAYIGVSVNAPLFRGGYTAVNNRINKANYLTASNQLQFIYRSVQRDTRQAFLNVQSGESQIDADYQSILANEKQLEATRAAYLVGSRTMVDVLNAIAQLYQSKKVWAGHRYDYLESILQLKYNAGTLSPQDIKKISGMLKGKVVVDFAPQRYKLDPYYRAAMQQVFRGKQPKKIKLKRHKAAMKAKPKVIRPLPKKKKRVDTILPKPLTKKTKTTPVVSQPLSPVLSINLPNPGSRVIS